MPHESLIALAYPTLSWPVEALGLFLLLIYELLLARVYRVAPERTYRGCSDRLRLVWASAAILGGIALVILEKQQTSRVQQDAPTDAASPHGERRA